jgi:hypothetical protein
VHLVDFTIEIKVKPPSSVASKNEWKNISALSYAFMGKTEINLIYFLGHCLCSSSDMSHFITGLRDFCISGTEQIFGCLKSYVFV